MDNMKTKNIDRNELMRLKFSYYSETLWNNSYCGKKKQVNKCKKLLKTKYGIVGHDSVSILNKIDKMIKSN